MRTEHEIREDAAVPEPEQIMWWFCACEAYPDDPGMVVCWKCEQPVIDIQDTRAMTGILTQNLLLLCVRYRKALEEIEGSPRAGIGCPQQQMARTALNGR